MRRKVAISSAAAFLALTLTEPAMAGSVNANRGFWVIAGSFGDGGEDAASNEAQRLSACSHAAFGTEFSGKFATFSPGLMVVVAGGYRTQGEANAVKRRVQRCGSADAYVKFSAHNNGE